MGADGATSCEGAAESQRRRRRRGLGRFAREGYRIAYCICIYMYLPLTCHKVFSESGKFVNVNRARGLANIILYIHIIGARFFIVRKI